MAVAIGFIGLGTMGAPMVRRLLTNGHAVTVWARRRDAIAALTSAGARAGDSPADVASQADIVMTMVTDTKAVEDVVLDRDLLSIPPAELSSATVQLTLVGGERVYAAGDLA